jgi:phosphatidate cytidylyltransferase
MLPVLMLVSVLATFEHLRMQALRGLPSWRGLVLIGAALLPASGFLQGGIGGWSPGISSAPLLVFSLVLIAVFIAQMTLAVDEAPLSRLAGSAFGLAYVPVLLLFLGLLLNPGDGRDGRILALYLIAVTKLCDMGAYFTGRAIGRTKLIPRISPNKTWEGVIGGLVWSTAASYAFYHFTGGLIGGVQFRLVDALLLPPVLGSLGVLGDLAKSVMKRAAGVKDSGTVFAGMGGMLDVIDSLLFTGPFLFLYITLFR